MHDFFKPSPELTLIKKHKLNDIKGDYFKKVLLKQSGKFELTGEYKYD